MEESLEIVKQEFDKYKEDAYMSTRIAQYIKLLPNLFGSFKNNHMQRVLRAEELSADQDVFIQSFLKNHKYYYLGNIEKFFYYDEVVYHIVTEDDILHHILTSITKDRQITPWKQKTKVSIMKTIKQNNLFKSIPNSDTIQIVLDVLYPALFLRKSHAKYFLTVIGDSILKKQGHIIHFINLKAKSFLRELNNYAQVCMGANILQTFKYKYHEHEYSQCRMFPIQEAVKTETLWAPILRKHFLNILSVAVHYSTRFSSSDEFVTKYSNDEELMDTAFVLKNTTQTILIDAFFEEYIETVVPDTTNTAPVNSISWKNMLYLWKHYLDAKGLPSVIWQQNLKTIFIDRFSTSLQPLQRSILDTNANLFNAGYNATDDLFLNVYSKYIPFIQKFLLFWNENMIEDVSEFDFEIDEIHSLYKQWCKSNNDIVPINEKQILDLVYYYFPHIEIENDKFIYKIRCLLWNKQSDVLNALENIRESIKEQLSTPLPNASCQSIASSPALLQNVSIYELYEMYCKENGNKMTDKLIVSKNYFEKCIFENLSGYVIDNKFISIEWFITEVI